MLHVRHALMNKSVPSSAKQQREITTLGSLRNDDGSDHDNATNQ